MFRFEIVYDARFADALDLNAEAQKFLWRRNHFPISDFVKWSNSEIKAILTTRRGTEI